MVGIFLFTFYICSEQMAIVAHLMGIFLFTFYICREQMAIVAHLVGIEQLGYEKELGMTPSVREISHFKSTVYQMTFFCCCTVSASFLESFILTATLQVLYIFSLSFA